jgi:thiol-disulfide isomerase/thioredoxin
MLNLNKQHVLIVLFIALVLYCFMNKGFLESFGCTKPKPKLIFVMYGVGWCGYCKQTKPKFDSLARQLNNSNIDFKYVDCDENEKIATKKGIDRYPMFFLEKDSCKDIEFKEGFDPDKVMEFLNKHTGL